MKGKRPFEHSSHELACVCIGRGDFFLRKEEKENMEQRERERRDLNALHTPHPPPLQ